MKKKAIKIISAVVLVVLAAAVLLYATGFFGGSHKNPNDFQAKAASYVGSCGENIRWSLNTVTGKLVFEGKGGFDKYDSPDDIPWRIYSKYIKEVTVENGITEISPYLLYRAKQLTSVSVPRTVKTIGDCAFFGCGELISVEFAENSSLAAVGESAFAYCRSLKDFDMPTRVSSIGKNAFLCCYSLNDMTLGYSVTSIGEGAFSSCSNLKKLRIVNYNCDIFDDGETVYRNIQIECFGNSTAKEYAEKYLRTYSVIKDMKNINDMKVGLSYSECVYDGKKKKPEVKIKGLKSGRDYTVNYSENIEPGVGTVTVSAAGSTLGEVTLDFVIKPQRPKSLRVRKATENSLELTWNEVHGASGYELFKYNGKKWKKIATVNATGFTINKLSGATEYKFKVRAFVDSDGERVYSKQSAVCQSATKPKTVKITSVVNRGVGRLTISWDKVNGADGYIVYTSLKKNGGFKEAAVLNGSSKTKCVLQKLKSNKKYYVTVKSFVKSGKAKIISDDGNIVSKSPM